MQEGAADIVEGETETAKGAQLEIAITDLQAPQSGQGDVDTDGEDLFEIGEEIEVAEATINFKRSLMNTMKTDDFGAM